MNGGWDCGQVTEDLNGCLDLWGGARAFERKVEDIWQQLI